MKKFSECTKEDIINFLNAETACYERARENADAFREFLEEIKEEVDAETRKKIENFIEENGRLNLEDIDYKGIDGIVFD